MNLDKIETKIEKEIYELNKEIENLTECESNMETIESKFIHLQELTEMYGNLLGA